MPQLFPIGLGLVNVYLIKGEKKSILIDCGFPGQEKAILLKLAKLGINKGDLSLIVITHGDIDHYGSSARLRELLKAPVLIHEADSQIIRTGLNRKISARNFAGQIMKKMALLLTALTKNRYRPYEPDLIMTSRKFSLQDYGVDAYLIHTPGETAGSISVVLPDNRIIVGDLIAGVIPHSSI